MEKHRIKMMIDTIAKIVAGDGQRPRPGQGQANDDPIEMIGADEADGIARLDALGDEAVGQAGGEAGQLRRGRRLGAVGDDLQEGRALALRREATKKIGGHPHTVVVPLRRIRSDRA